MMRKVNSNVIHMYQKKIIVGTYKNIALKNILVEDS